MSGDPLERFRRGLSGEEAARPTKEQLFGEFQNSFPQIFEAVCRIDEILSELQSGSSMSCAASAAKPESHRIFIDMRGDKADGSYTKFTFFVLGRIITSLDGDFQRFCGGKSSWNTSEQAELVNFLADYMLRFFKAPPY